MRGEEAADRVIWRISGKDRESFLQNIVTNDLGRLKTGLVYSALLTPQGKYLADFFLVPLDEAILLDVSNKVSESLIRRLSMYRLRADVKIEPCQIHVTRGLGPAAPDAFADPRDPSLGWRRYQPETGDPPSVDWDAVRVAGCIPESGIELIPDESYILECGFERLNGVDFRKGCYVGQEVTARMKHKTELRKGLVSVGVSHPVPVGTPILSGEKPAGTLFTQSGGRGIAYLRFDRMDEPMAAGDAFVTPDV